MKIQEEIKKRLEGLKDSKSHWFRTGNWKMYKEFQNRIEELEWVLSGN